MRLVKQLGYVSFGVCKAFKMSVDNAITQAGLQYHISKETTQENISILFRESMLKFTSNLVKKTKTKTVLYHVN